MGPPVSRNSKDATWRIAFDVRLRTNNLESCPQAVERISSESRANRRAYPLLFRIRKQTRKEHKLLLAFDALLLSDAVGCEVNLAKSCMATATLR